MEVEALPVMCGVGRVAYDASGGTRGGACLPIPLSSPVRLTPSQHASLPLTGGTTEHVVAPLARGPRVARGRGVPVTERVVERVGVVARVGVVERVFEEPDAFPFLAHLGGLLC